MRFNYAKLLKRWERWEWPKLPSVKPEHRPVLYGFVSARTFSDLRAAVPNCYVVISGPHGELRAIPFCDGFIERRRWMCDNRLWLWQGFHVLEEVEVFCA